MSDQPGGRSKPEHLLERLEAEGRKVVDFAETLDASAWAAEIYEDGDVWTVHQIMAHLVSVERAFQQLTADIAAGGQGTPRDFDLDRFNREQVAELVTQTPAQLIDLFRSERQATLRQAASYGPRELARQGRHPWFGQLSVAKLLRLLYQHAQLHLRDIRRAL